MESDLRFKPFDEAGKFIDPADDGQLARRTVRNAGVTVFAQASVFAIQLLGTMVLARLLTPSDFGIVTMVTTFSLLLASFGLAGFTEAILQADGLNERQASNLFWVNLGGAFVLSTAFGAAGSLLARFYSNPLITTVAMGFSVVILFSITPIVHLALLKRAMLFGQASTLDILSRVAYVIAAIVCAMCGWRYWALVGGYVAQQLMNCAGAWRLCPWIPRLPQSEQGTGKMLKYAAGVYGRFTLNYFTGNTDNLLVGWRLGAIALGFYKKAFDLFVLPSGQLLSPILAVVITTLSRKNKDLEEYKRYFLRGLGMVAFVGMAVGASLTLTGREVVRCLLGAQWGQAGRIFVFFAPGIGLLLIYQTTGWIHLSLGTTMRWLRWTVVELSLACSLFLVGLRWGPAGVAGAWTTLYCLLIVPGFLYALRPLKLSIVVILDTVWRFMVAAIAAAWICARILKNVPMPPQLAIGGVGWAIARIVLNNAVFGLLYLVILVLLFRSMEPLLQFARLLPDMVPGYSSWRSRANRKVGQFGGSTAADPALSEIRLENTP
jgi:O-antigen/teichoic acid export membrane protein